MPLAAILLVGFCLFIFFLWVHRRKGNLPLSTVMVTSLNFLSSLLRNQYISFSESLFLARDFRKFLLNQIGGDNETELQDMIEKQRADQNKRHDESIRQDLRNELDRQREQARLERLQQAERIRDQQLSDAIENMHREQWDRMMLFHRWKKISHRNRRRRLKHRSRESRRRVETKR